MNNKQYNTLLVTVKKHWKIAVQDFLLELHVVFKSVLIKAFWKYSSGRNCQVFWEEIEMSVSTIGVYNAIAIFCNIIYLQ